MDYFDYNLAALAVLTVALAGTALWVQRLRRQLEQLRQTHEAAVATLRGDLKALYDSSVGMGEELRALERRFKYMEERQDQLDLKDPGYQAYARAIQLVQDGADVDQITATCGLSHGEAELIRMLHRMENHEGSS